MTISLSFRAEKFAKSIHRFQVDKAGKSYVQHLKAVVDGLINPSDEVIAVAWLHDSVEDTDIGLDVIEHCFGKVVSDAVDSITKRKDEPYMDYLKRVKANPISRVVKISDLTHNMDLSRLDQITDKDLARLEKYKKAKEFLLLNEKQE